MKRLPGLRELSDDHHAGLVLARRCKQAGRADAVESLALVRDELQRALAGALGAHFEIEERLLLPALEALGEAEHARRIRDEHRALRALAAEPARAESLAQLGALLDSHIRFEEREVFEHAQHRLAPAVRDAIAEACRRARAEGGV